jgi:hypothetical protein
MSVEGTPTVTLSCDRCGDTIEIELIEGGVDGTWLVPADDSELPDDWTVTDEDEHLCSNRCREAHAVENSESEEDEDELPPED